MDDVVMQLPGGKSIRVPGKMMEPGTLSRAHDFLVHPRDDGVGLYFTTDEPTAEGIASGGDEVVATSGVVMNAKRFFEFVQYLEIVAKKLRQ